MFNVISFHSFSDELVKIANYFESLKASAPEVTTVIDPEDPTVKWLGGYYYPKYKKIVTQDAKDYGLLAHELGHHEFGKSTSGRLLQSAPARAASYLSPFGSLAAAKLWTKGHRWSPAIPAAMLAPTMISEYMATKKGKDKLRALGASEKEVEKGRLGRGKWSYVGMAALGMGAMPLYVKMMKLAQVDTIQQKTQWTCAAACLKAVLSHLNYPISEIEAGLAIRVRKKRGAEVDQITDAAKRLGFKGSFDKSFESLDEAAKFVPIIADIQSFNHPGKGHYVVITKITDNEVHLMDPNTKGNSRILSRQEMEDRWWDYTMAKPHKRVNRWGIVVRP